MQIKEAMKSMNDKDAEQPTTRHKALPIEHYMMERKKKMTSTTKPKKDTKRNIDQPPEIVRDISPHVKDMDDFIDSNK